jgi:diguanylate cyclase (GGDEF)-like protein
MHLLSWVDNRTIIACYCLLATVYAVLLLAARKLQPHTEGIGSLALGSLLGLPTALLLASHGHIPPFGSVICAALLAFLAYILLYRGLLQFCGGQNRRMHGALGCSAAGHSGAAARRVSVSQPPPVHPQYRGQLPLLCVVCTASLCGLIYFTLFHPRLNAQIVIWASTMALARGLMAWCLFRNAEGRRHLRLFAASLAAFALINLYHATATLLHGTPTNIMEFDGIQTGAWLGSLIFIAINGVFYVTMINSSVVEMIEQNAQIDFVTSTLNRRGIEKALQAEIERANRRSQPVAVLLIDLDHFKRINDRFGHAVGDQALREIAHCISTSVRAYDSLGRYGGDEFLVLLPDTVAEEAAVLAARMREAARSLSLPEGPVNMTLSIGGTHSIGREDASEILARADQALYQAKHSGRDCARVQMPPKVSSFEPFRRHSSDRTPKTPIPVTTPSA